MKNKAIRLLALLLSLLMLAGCSFGGTGNGSGDDKSRLDSILDKIAQNIQPGTAGNTLTILGITAELITWAGSTEMSVSETTAAVSDWLGRHPELKDAFTEHLQSVADSFTEIVGGTASDLLADAGVNSDFSNLGTRLQELVKAILATGGVR